MANNNSSKHEIILVLPEGDAGWLAWSKISSIDCCHFVTSKHESTLDIIPKKFQGILVLPLFAKEKGRIIPFGLNLIKLVRLQGKNYTCTPLFLVPSEIDIPPVPVTPDFVSSFAKDIIKNPSFGDDLKAVFFAELIYERESSDEKKLLNLLNLTETSAQGIKDSAIKLNKLSYNPELRELFYHTFVTFYNPFGEIEKGGRFLAQWTAFKKSCELKNSTDTYGGIDVYNILTLANEAYNALNGINKDSSHNVELELFRAPVPFPLNELLEAKNKIKTTLRTNENNDETKNTIKLLLIDNKIDKVRNDKGVQTLGDLLKIDSEIGKFLELRMLGQPSWTSISDLIKSDNFQDEYSETFNFELFRKGFKAYIEDNIENQNEPEKEYLLKVYNRVKEAHFVLLDFFLNKENTYLAFDFIKDMAAIKRQEGDVSTTWYFITSAVYDSVVKYSQSGLLAEYYESAVVSAGDDPTNKKRQIIFLYKLLTFINARLKNFCTLQETIYNRLLKDKDEVCKHWDKEEKKCVKDAAIKCLEKEMLVIIRRYLNEFNDVKDIFFPDDTEIKKWQDILESLENIIKQFIWLPEADWYMVQHQIDFINNKLSSLQDKSLKKCKFSCRYILKELEDRSEVY